MNKRIVALFLALILLLALLSGCRKKAPAPAEQLASVSEQETLVSVAEESAPPSTPEQSPESSTAPPSIPELSSLPAESSREESSRNAEKSEPQEQNGVEAQIDEDGEYTSPEEVALYINTYRRLPSNFITKDAARALGWDSSLGNLQKVAPGKSIGGDRFGNYEGLLPKGKYFECDVNYRGGYRGSERLIYKTDGTVYYTKDHYESFERLY